MHVGLRHRNERIAAEVHAETGGFRIRVDGQEHRVEVVSRRLGKLVLLIDGKRHYLDVAQQGRERWIGIGGETYRFEPDLATGGPDVGNVVVPEITAPMPGKVTQVLIRPGDRVAAGDTLLILEAMKMENRLLAEAAGSVEEVRVAPGDMVNGGQILLVLRYDAP